MIAPPLTKRKCPRSTDLGDCLTTVIRGSGIKIIEHMAFWQIDFSGFSTPFYNICYKQGNHRT